MIDRNESLCSEIAHNMDWIVLASIAGVIS